MPCGWRANFVLSPVIRSRSLSNSVPLDCEVSQVLLSPLLGGTGWLEWARVGYSLSSIWKSRAHLVLGLSLPPGHLGSDKNPCRKGSGSSFFWEQPFKEEYSAWHISKWLLSNPPVGSKRGELVEVKTHKTVSGPIPDGWVPLEVLTLTCPYWAYSDSAITVQIFLPWHLFPKSFLLWWVVILCDCVCLPLTFGWHWFAPWPNFS